MASISKPPGKKTWIIQFYYQGKKYRKSLKVANRRDALLLKQMIERKLAEGTFDPVLMLQKPQQNSQRVTRLSQLLASWKSTIERKKDISEKTKIGYLHSAELLLHITGDLPLLQINRGFVQDYILTELNQLYDSIGTVKSKMTSFRAIFSFAVRNEILPANPFSGQVPRTTPGRPVFFRNEEIQQYIDYWKNPARPEWAQTYFITLLNTGNRMTEHFNLKWSENIFLEQAIIRFKGKGRYGGKERIVPLNDACIDAFRNARRQLGEDRVFWQIRTVEAVKSAWDVFKKRTGWKYKLHNTRSNHASWMIMKGESVEKVMEIHGWEDYETYKLYRGLSKEFLQADRNLINW